MSPKNLQRIVIKIGSSTLTHPGGKLNFSQIDALVRQMVDLKNMGKDIALVSSGAVGAGMAELGLKEKPLQIPEQQACAAIGQGLLIGIYNKFFQQYGEKAAQILLTASDLENRNRYLNANNTIESLLSHGIIPVINENDTVVTDEIKFGDNDTLSARVASLIEADLLINLSDIDGFYNRKPAIKDKDIQLISVVEKIDQAIIEMAGSPESMVGTGGMVTKIMAAQIATESGIMMIIGPGQQRNILLKLVEMAEKGKYEIGTTFLPCESILCKRKQWLNYNLPAEGTIIVDEGAVLALTEKKKSLLPGGILKVKLNFNSGEMVNIKTSNGKKIGKGISNYSASEIKKIKGHHSSQIIEILGYINQVEVIHRDNMIIKEGNFDEY